MGSLRIRWRAVAKATGILVAVLFGLRLLPSLLEPGTPPPLAPDIGLSRLRPKASRCRLKDCGAQSPTNPSIARVGAARALVSEPPRRDAHPAARHPAGARRRAAAAAAESAPAEPVEPAPAVEPPPPAAVASPGDGSMEFAPH